MNIKTSILTLLAAIVTPWVLLVATANSLFLTNQADLGYDLRTYIPFLTAFAAMTAAGFTLLSLASRRQALWPWAWGYLLGGVAALLFMATVDKPLAGRYQAVWVVLLGAMTLIGALLLQGRSPARVAPLFALYALFLIGADVVRFGTAYRFSVPDRTTTERSGAEDRNLPNIYHLLLDGYQADVFPLTLGDSARRELGDFTLFGDNITVSGRTRISIPSVFAGRTWSNDEAIADYTDEAMNSPRSLLHGLRRAGYTTSAYLHTRFAFEPNLFDETYYHHNATHHRDLSDGVFVDLWVYRFLPRLLSHRILDAETRSSIRRLDLSPDSYAVTSHDIFLDFLAREETEPAQGRYVFVHLILPHHPYVLDGDCRYTKKIEPIEQFQCATREVLSLVRRLKELERYDDSMIVAQGDHGLDFTVRSDGTLEENAFNAGGVSWNRPRSKAMLLIKQPGARGETLREIERETTLLDITPTIYEAAGAQPPAELEGRALFSAEAETPRTRYYHYFESDYTEELYRFAVSEKFRFDRILRPEGFHAAVPTFPAGRVIEAEDAFVPDGGRTEVASRIDGVSGSHVRRGSLFFKVRIERAGDYSLRARICTDTGDANRMLVSLDEGPYAEWKLPTRRDWAWEPIPFGWTLDAGEHLVIVRQKGPTLIDQLELRQVRLNQ